MAKIGEHKDSMRMAELQRRIMERWETDGKHFDLFSNLQEFEHERDFKALVPKYKMVRKKVQQKINDIKARPKEPLLELLKVREEYGDYPELEAAIRQARHEIAKQAAQEDFRKIVQASDHAKTLQHWSNLQESLKKVQYDLLSQEQNAQYSRLEYEIDSHIILAEEMKEHEFEAFLTSGAGGRARRWVEALQSLVDAGSSPSTLNEGSIKNLELCVKNLLKRKPSKAAFLSTYRQIDRLIERLDRLDRSTMERESLLAMKQKPQVA
jgi:hypothetical protein